ncbi:MAG: N-acetylmuramoyl-L-alanine amidase [Minwuia sp.]|uniref:N-acetylmuramoyl-L-alanine amidase n=1 Tax=Minwuia sp. TaxID=2493630 RepID=UPI003A8C846D
MTRSAGSGGLADPVLIERPSPNFDSRRGRAVDMILIHYTGMQSAAESLDRLCDPAAKVSAHYLIEEDGAVHRMVGENDRAWHAGVGRWAGETDINAISIGIELQNPGHEFGYRPFPPPQIAALTRLLDGIRTRHDVPNRRILGHSDVAPERKEDPGELFPWAALAAAGHGTWAETGGAPASEDEAMAALTRIGYGLQSTTAPDLSGAVILAFQRHYLPGGLSGRLDLATASRICEIAAAMFDE